VKAARRKQRSVEIAAKVIFSLPVHYASSPMFTSSLPARVSINEKRNIRDAIGLAPDRDDPRPLFFIARENRPDCSGRSIAGIECNPRCSRCERIIGRNAAALRTLRKTRAIALSK